jgi:hypothetical protein
MASFDDRKKGFEEKFKHDRELDFKVTARRNRLLGLWAAKELGIPAAEAEAYAKSVVMADFEKPGDDDVVGKIVGDAKAKGIDISEHRVRKHMDELLTVARQQLMSETK